MTSIAVMSWYVEVHRAGTADKHHSQLEPSSFLFKNCTHTCHSAHTMHTCTTYLHGTMYPLVGRNWLADRCMLRQVRHALTALSQWEYVVLVLCVYLKGIILIDANFHLVAIYVFTCVDWIHHGSIMVHSIK